MKTTFQFWTFILLIWLLSTGLDRLWWDNYSGLPSWDQADYLNSALDHGRALGLIQGGQWHGWGALLDLSPKIPPLASLINGSIIAIAGDSPSQAAWSLSIWNGVLLVSVAAWGLCLRGKDLALLATMFVALIPALLELRSDYVLEMPLTALITLSLWRLGCWCDPNKGGKWIQAIFASISCAAAILIKQSALLVLLPALIWATVIAIRKGSSSILQVFTGLGLVLFSVIPWLKHNWITTIGGTNRAVFESAVKEGDPSLLSLDNWIWYPRLIPGQVGWLLLVIGISGALLLLLFRPKKLLLQKSNIPFNDNKQAWQWLLVVLVGSWVLTSINPNKGDRYIAPLLPLLILCLSRGWIQWRLWGESYLKRNSFKEFPFVLIVGLLATLPTAWSSQTALLKKGGRGPLEEIVKTAGGANPNSAKTTVIVVPSTPDLNQHNVSYFGRRNGGSLVGRQLGSNINDIEPLLSHGQWVILAEGELGSVRSSAIELDKAVRMSGFFEKLKSFPRKNGGSYSLWKRRKDAPIPKSFSENFPNLAIGLEQGPKGLEKVFTTIDSLHMLDGHMQYRIEVRQVALKLLAKNPEDIKARWTMALVEALANRPKEAATHFAVLEELLPNNSWPSAYHAAVTLADWDPWKAKAIATKAKKSHLDPVLDGLSDLSGVMGGALWLIPSASKSIPLAIRHIEDRSN